MPNWCNGNLIIDTDEYTLEKILAFVRGNDRVFDFEKVIPMPDHIYRGSLGTEEQKLYGKNNWYDWSCENWGTKWNACDGEIMGDCIHFWTAWAPCSPVIAELARLFPGVSFWYRYTTESDTCGVEAYENGKLVYSMAGDFRTNWRAEEDDCKEDDLLHDNLYPIQEYGELVDAKNNEIHIREYINGRISLMIDGKYQDERTEIEPDYWI